MFGVELVDQPSPGVIAVIGLDELPAGRAKGIDIRFQFGNRFENRSELVLVKPLQFLFQLTTVRGRGGDDGFLHGVYGKRRCDGICCPQGEDQGKKQL